MSGGHFDYKDFQIREFAEDLQTEIDTNNKPDEHGSITGYSDKTINKLQNYQKLLVQMGEIARVIDRLYSGDIGEEDLYDECGKIMWLNKYKKGN